MRQAFVEELCLAAEKNPDLWLLTGDLGFSVLEPFAEQYADRFINVGVAEQNMVGMAAGLALSGMRVVTYSIVNFATIRCLEQIRNDIVYHGLNVMIVGIGAGFSYGTQGYTHHGVEDISAVRSLGEIDVISPADQMEVRFGVRKALQLDGPSYLRLAKGGEVAIHRNERHLDRGRFGRVKDGDQALIVATGELVAEALAAAELLEAEGVNVAVWSAPWLNPIDEEGVREASSRYHTILTVEEADGRGGLGAAVSGIVAAQAGDRARVISASTSGYDKHGVLSQTSTRQVLGLDAAGLAKRLKAGLNR